MTTPRSPPPTSLEKYFFLNVRNGIYIRSGQYNHIRWCNKWNRWRQVGLKGIAGIFILFHVLSDYLFPDRTTRDHHTEKA